jgi:hypothetical protein
MPALPADGVLRAAQRWLRLLQRSTVEQAAALLRADSAYTDLTITQYSTALEWLRGIRLIQDTPAGSRLAPETRGLPADSLAQILFTRGLEALDPPWLPDADVLVRDTADLPQDAADLAAVLRVTDAAALVAVRQIHGRIDLAERARVGAAGELGLVALLEQRWPGSTSHVALTDDGLGYDIAVTLSTGTWHLEVKTTGRRGRLVLFVSRHEHDVGLVDPTWRLVVVGLGEDGQPAALATARHAHLQDRSPHDYSPASRWESVRHRLTPADLIPGLTFLGGSQDPADTDSLLDHGSREIGQYAWMPMPSPP